MKSRIAFVAAASALTLLASGCGGTSSGSEDSNVLEFQTGQTVDSALMTTFTELTDQFKEEHPDIEVDLVPTTQSYEADMKVRLASGNVPDIWYTHGWSLLRYSEFLMPLDEEPWAENFNPALDSAMRNDDGQFFALPVDTDIAGVLYNGEVLEAAGVDPNDLDTWTDFTDAAKAVKANGVTPIYVSGKDNGPAGNVADWIAPGAFSDQELEKFSNGEFVEDGYSQILELVAQWREADYFNPDFASATQDDISRALSQGDAAFAFGQNDYAQNGLQYNPDADLGFVPVPNFEGGKKYLIGGEMNAYGIAKETNNPEAAKAYLAFLAQPENLSKLAAAAGSAPGLTNAEADLGVFQDSYETFVENDDLELKPYFDRVYLPNGMWNTMVTTTGAVITGQSDVQTAVNQMKTDFNSLYGQNK
ncbi:ABC transporter substrate-binding protein [Arthrobacter sp. H14]|uniref:ABC transporter substrate-binding protein n=1 Tax=Arthrobacter sp. H14 TaxID=1312959 RepID=UPI0004AD5197|nr:ABC transporter substrate-binding protein [Arthrobacter sp. H14]